VSASWTRRPRRYLPPSSSDTGCSSTPAPAILDAIYHQTEGNAFFLEEVVNHLHESGHDLTDPQPVVELAVPESVRQVIGRRLTRLNQDTQRMLQTAAVMGDDIAIDILGAASGLTIPPLLDALDAALRAGLLAEAGDRYQFSHALVRQTLMDELSLHRRQWLHLRIAHALEAARGGTSPDDLATLAMHYRLAGPTADPTKALTYSRQAGDAAASVFAWEQAVDHWQTVLNLLAPTSGASVPADEAQRCEVLLALGAAQVRAGDLSAAMATFLEACEIARTLPSPEPFAQGALAYGDLPNHRAGEVQQLRVDLLEEAIGAVDEDATPAVAAAKLPGLVALLVGRS